MTEFDVDATFNATVAPQSLRSARQTIEDSLNDIEVQVAAQTSAGAGGDRQIASRERAMQRQLQTQQVDALTGIEGALDEPAAAPGLIDEWEVEHDLSERRNDILLELLDQMEQDSFDRATRGGGGGMAALGVAGAFAPFVAAGGLAAGALTVGDELMDFLGDYEAPDLGVPPIPDLDAPDLPPLEPPSSLPALDVDDPDWLPITIDEPEWLPILPPDGEGEDTPGNRDENPSRDPSRNPDRQPGPRDSPGPTAVPDGRDEVPDTPSTPDRQPGPLDAPGPTAVPDGTGDVPDDLPPRVPGGSGSPDSGPLGDVGIEEIIGGGVGAGVGAGLLKKIIDGSGAAGGSSAGVPFALPSILGAQDAQREDQGLLEELFNVDWSAGGGMATAAIGPAVQAASQPGRSNRAGDRRRERTGGDTTANVTVEAAGVTQRDLDQAFEDVKRELRREFQSSFSGGGGLSR
ncbi:hypothetical protein Hbl1158_02885 [Halobaculum sp. CBA1158]|uniref:hypothetical protein n=1 Tax=Halobaculum sp. CBA1158 TaxID=2904243 RepID=UPI001F289E37|nr:hypothetical protein [Halobaculum sp. CBA1158]UIP00332.1 hypothetical protein Hbl1158_02885 [Halobaculum sp. CBA1158]